MVLRMIPDTYRYWSNCCGDLFRPGDDGKAGEDIDVKDLPGELKTLFETLWTEDAGFRCYLIELDGQYGIALEDEYSRETAALYDISYEQYLHMAVIFAEHIQKRFSWATVMYTKDYHEWSDGSKDSIVTVFMPFGIVTQKNLAEVAKYMDVIHPVHVLNQGT